MPMSNECLKRKTHFRNKCFFLKRLRHIESGSCVLSTAPSLFQDKNIMLNIWVSQHRGGLGAGGPDHPEIREEVPRVDPAGGGLTPPPPHTFTHDISSRNGQFGIGAAYAIVVLVSLRPRLKAWRGFSPNLAQHWSQEYYNEPNRPKCEPFYLHSRGMRSFLWQK